MEPEGAERTVGTDITVDCFRARGLLVVEESSGSDVHLSTGHSSILWLVDLSRNIGLELFSMMATIFFRPTMNGCRVSKREKGVFLE